MQKIDLRKEFSPEKFVVEKIITTEREVYNESSKFGS
jgi:hypothetical protein